MTLKLLSVPVLMSLLQAVITNDGGEAVNPILEMIHCMFCSCIGPMLVATDVIQDPKITN